MPDAPLVSIVIPTHNRDALLRGALDALRAQTDPRWEAVVVDDHSTDLTVMETEAAGREDPRIRLVRLPAGSRGGPAGRNLGAREALGEFVVFFDSDDLVAPLLVEQRLRVMAEHPDLGFAVFGCEQFRKTPGDLNRLWNTFSDDSDPAAAREADLDRFLAKEPVWQTTSPIWRRSALDRVGPWDESAPSSQDWEFHIRAILSGVPYRTFGPAQNLPPADCYWRIPEPTRHSIGMSSITADHAKAHPRLIDKMRAAVEAAGAMNDCRRALFSNLYWQSIDRVARKVGRRDARAAWAKLRGSGLYSPREWLQGYAFLLASRLPGRAESAERWLRRRWPAGRFGITSPTYLKAPADPSRPPEVSVMMPARDAERYLRGAIDSILVQSQRDFELVIVDDGSTDRTRAIARDAASRDCRVRVVDGPGTGQGPAGARNAGLRACRGEFVALMDADDLCHPERLQRQVEFLRNHPDVVAAGTQVTLVDPYGVTIGEPTHATTHDEIDDQMLRQGIGWAIVNPSAMLRRSAVEQVGGYREQWCVTEDLDLFLRLAEVGHLANLPDRLVSYRQHLSSVSHAKAERQKVDKRRVIEEAYRRRGLAVPEGLAMHDKPPTPPAQQRRQWGWLALKQRVPVAARRHALSALAREPLNLTGWRLMYCAIRGR